MAGNARRARPGWAICNVTAIRMTHRKPFTGPDRGRRSDIVRNAFALDSNNLGRRVVSGASFAFLGIALRTLITLGSVSILARLLLPADFGYIAMATVVTEFAALFSGFGFANILIQRPVANRLQFDTVFWASAVLGAITALGVFALSFLAGWLFADPITGSLLRVLCWTFLLGGLTTVHEAILARLMRFRTEFWIQVTALAIRSATAIAFAYLGFGVWSLVAGALAGSLMTVIFNFVAVPYFPRLKFNAAYLASTWTISGSYLGRGLLYYADMNIDLALIGRHLGATSLGYYQNARSLTDEVRGRIAMPLQRVLFPAFSALLSDNRRFQESVIRSGRVLAAIVIPVGVGASAIAPELVPVLYGPRWLAMIPVVTMLGISTALKASTAIASPIFSATNRVDLALKYSVFGTVLITAAVVFAIPYGVDAVAFAIAIASLYTLVIFRVGLGLIGLGTREGLVILGPPATAAAVMWLSVMVARPVSSAWIANPGLLLLTHIALGSLTYTLTLHLVSRQYLRDFRELARRFFGKY
jgi:O-antigen/teichoic acid export membrane protein